LDVLLEVYSHLLFTSKDSVKFVAMRTLAFFSALLLVVSTAFAVESLLQSFTARSTGSSVTIEWRTSGDAAVGSFEVERAGTDNVFRFVSALPSRGAGQTHSYVDEDVFAKGDGMNEIQNTSLQYRLKLVRPDKSFTYSNSVSVTHSVSSVKRTWGMIKEMFR
jgi:uncharacterized membrane protein